MTIVAKPLWKEPKIYSLQAYLQKEERAAEKHEFYNGQIVRMPGAKAKHNLIASNILTAMNIAVDSLENNYLIFNSDQKIFIEAANIAVYPDALVVFEKPKYYKGREDLLTNPLLIEIGRAHV